jgi:hypothetical protein
VIVPVPDIVIPFVMIRRSLDPDDVFSAAPFKTTMLPARTAMVLGLMASPMTPEFVRLLMVMTLPLPPLMAMLPPLLMVSESPKNV